MEVSDFLPTFIDFDKDTELILGPEIVEKTSLYHKKEFNDEINIVLLLVELFRTMNRIGYFREIKAAAAKYLPATCMLFYRF